MTLAELALHSEMEDEPGDENRRGSKADSAYRTISEVALDLNLPQHVLRFWETKFKQISPLKRGGGRRYYRPQDVDLIKRIHYLLYTQGYTIKGVQKLLSKDKQLQQSVPTLLGNDMARVVVDDAIQQKPASNTSDVKLDGHAGNDLHILLQRLKNLRAQMIERC
ncbi:MAG: transcriptional regulator, MerR family [Alphaproteobacteria bacterium]|nr:transcriptional regulator, MerR family [Alphaproteobacteria bacterium]